MRSLLLTTLCLTLLFITGCQEEPPQTAQSPPASAPHDNSGNRATLPVVVQETTAEKEQPGQAEQPPPEPPVFEDFQGAPQLSLFPRAGDFRPAEESDRFPYWKTFIEHLVKVSSVAEEKVSGNRVWAFRSIKSIDSLGYFSPLGVKPQATYQVSFKLAAELTEGASAGIGILEFNKFLWIPNQYNEEIFRQHFLNAHEGQRLTGETKDKHTFTFTTGPETRMIHLVLFREGPHDRNGVRFDDIGIKEAQNDK